MDSICNMLWLIICWGVPLIICPIFILILVLPSTRRIVRSFVIRKDSIFWRALIFSLMFYMSSLFATFVFYVIFNKNISLGMGISLFMMLYIPLISLGSFLLYILTSYLLKKKYWFILCILGTIYGFVSVFVLFLTTMIGLSLKW